MVAPGDMVASEDVVAFEIWWLCRCGSSQKCGGFEDVVDLEMWWLLEMCWL